MQFSLKDLNVWKFLLQFLNVHISITQKHKYLAFCFIWSWLNLFSFFLIIKLRYLCVRMSCHWIQHAYVRKDVPCGLILILLARNNDIRTYLYEEIVFYYFLFLLISSVHKSWYVYRHTDRKTHRQKDTQTHRHTCHYCFYIGYWIRTVRVDNNMLRSFSHGTRVTGTYAEMCINFVDFLKWINLVIKKNRIRYYGSTCIINHEVFSYQKLFPPYG